MTAKVGLALSGGGARGLAHVGVLNVLQQEGIRIDLLAGTSMGGFLGAAYAAGMEPSAIKAEALRLSSPRRLWSLIDLTPPRRGLVEGHRVHEYVASLLGDRTFDDLRIPLTVVAADLNSCQQVHLNQGSVVDAVRATVALPGILAPVERKGQLLVDGGILNNLPIDVVRDMGADVVVAVNAVPDEQTERVLDQTTHRRWHIPSVLSDAASVMLRSIQVMRIELDRRRLAETPPDIILQPAIASQVGILTGFTCAEEIIAAGEAAAREALPQIRDRIATHARLRSAI
jgi:NTE family protein